MDASTKTELELLIEQRGAHDALSLPLFATNSLCASLMRAQQTELLATINKVHNILKDTNLTQLNLSLEARNLLTTLSSKLVLHFTLEDRFILNVLSKDQRSSSVVGQFDRDTSVVRSSFAGFIRSYPSVSSISNDLAGFAIALEKQEESIKNNFKGKNRELYPQFERLNSN